MNFACENCQRRYTIPDEKVRDRAVRIRCKACQHLMSVGPLPAEEPEPFVPAEQEDSTRMVSLDTLEQLRAQTKAPSPAGAQTPWDDEPTRAASAMEAALWFVSSGGKQVGPFGSEELRAKLQGGELAPKNFVWKKGMTDWKRLSELPELASLLEESAPPPQVPRFVPPAVSESFQPQSTDSSGNEGLFGSPEDLDARQDHEAPAASAAPQRDLDAQDLFADLELSKVMRAPPGLSDLQPEPDLPQQEPDQDFHQPFGEYASHQDPPQEEEEQEPELTPAPAPAKGKKGKPGRAAKVPAHTPHRGTFAMSAGNSSSAGKKLLATLLVLIALAAGLATAVHERMLPIEVPQEIQGPIDEYWPVPAKAAAPAPAARPAPVPAAPSSLPAPAKPDPAEGEAGQVESAPMDAAEEGP